MKFTYCILLYTFFQFLVTDVYPQSHKPTIEKQPGWVTVIKVDYLKSNLDNRAEDGYSDLNYEKQVSLVHKAVYYRTVVHILSEAGIQDQSQISVDFDPSYQTVAFHSIKIIRGNQDISQLNLANFKTIQQEKELKRSIYNGSLTAVLFLEDIRKDDIIEYSYTIKGFNPIVKNHYAEVYLTQFGVPVYQIFYKLIVPKSRNVTVKNTITTVQPKIETLGDEITYEWVMNEVAPLDLDDNLPSWYDCYPAVMVSEFKSWKEVNDWAMELYPFPATLPSNLLQKVQEIKLKYATVEEQVTAALRFVQDDVRYMGVEMGVSSHKPHAPAQIFKQRYGDCKDKAFLLCTLLRGLHVEAYPVLTNTSFKKTIGTWLPSPYAFNHVTVCAKVNNKTYWFDATSSYQRGPLQTISYPDYQTGLVIQPGTTSLTIIPLQETGKVTSKEIFYVTSSNGPVRLKVITTSSGSFADDIRYSFNSNSTKQIQKSYKELYTPYFKKVEADSLTYKDDDNTGFFTSTEYYTINDFWENNQDKSKILLEPYFINSVIKKPKSEKRVMPFALTYPARYEEQIEIQLPEDWPIEEGNFNFSEAAFAFDYKYSKPDNNTILLQYNYQNKQDHITPIETADYLDELTDANKTVAFGLTNRSNAYSSTLDANPGNGFTAAYVVLGIFALATYLYRRNRRADY
ncbi:MAG: hypothetical protein JWR72_2095 [Flavisolibacter sp.]|jgi:transglutaminase-like putative cysteine protease|nr:hypothetical protein [Flavisolibacter sp.]